MISVHWFKHWDKVFWIFFLIMAIAIVAGGVAGFISLEYVALLGISMFIIGAGKLASEISHRRLLNYQDDIYQKIHQLSQHMEKTFNIASMNKERTEFRFSKLDEKRKDVEKRMDRNCRDMTKSADKNYRELARKIIELENRMNRMSRALGIENKR